jgi:tetratricopeptide (TPR) repeat protein
MFFKGSIDHLPADKGMFSGPTPVILESCEESDLALLLSSNKRESSRIEFGAHQVVLVQSKEAKENLPSILKGAIVLTIFESKGLEFDDVLLYNFFHDSMVDEKGWRVVTAYLEEHEETIMVNKRLPGSNTDPRSFKFDERCHKALNSELKYLYTAVTRAKCNLWIYDSNQKKRLPMFDLWYKRDLVKVVGDNLVGCGDQHSLIFASISTPQQWKIQGDYFMRRSRWEQAKHCYDRAGPENLFLSVEANARFLVQQATRLAKPHLYLEAAVDFLHRDQLTHSVQCLVFTAQCLRRAKPQKFASAAVLFERLGKYGDALRCYRKAKDIPNCVRLLEREHRYDEAVRMIRAPKEAIAKASEYASKGVELSPDLMPDNLSYMYARHYAKRKDKTTLLEMLKYMPDAQRKARFMKEGGLYDEALEMYVSQGELDDAYRLASGQRLFPKGREIARNHQDLKKEAKFLFHQIHAEFFIKNENKGKKVPLPPQFQADLHALLKAGDPSIKAHTSLLLGIATDDAGLCRTAHGAFLRHHNKVAALEAFSALTNLGKHPKPTTRQVLNACTVAQEVQNALERASDLNQLVKQATSFYGVQKVRNVYLMPPDHNMWLSSKLQSECVVTNDDEKDLDGMIRLRNEATRDVMASFVGSFIKKWLDTYRVQNDIEQKMKSFKLHNDVEKKRFLLRVYTLHEIPWPGIKGYMENIINYCDLGLLVNDPKICDTATSVLLSIFSPQVAVYLPLSKQHVTTVRKAVSIRKSFHERIKRDLDHDEMNRMDVWFSAWRACTLSDGNAELVANVLNDLEEKVNDNFKNCSRSVDTTATSPTSPTKHMFSGMWKGSRFQAPPAFQYWKRDDYYFHTFSCWLYACSLIRNESKPSWAAKQAIYHLLGVVSQRKSLSISVMNFVDVLVVHCMSVFAMLTILNHHQNTRSAKFIVPFLYKNRVRLFDDLNCSQEGDAQVYVACANEVREAIKWNRAGRLRNDCYKLLDTALNILLGTYRIDRDLPAEEQKRFKVLTFAFRNDKVLSSGAAHHCLVLAITLFANCMPYQSQRKFEETRKMFNFFFSKVSEQGNIPGFLQEGRVIFQHSTTKDLGTKLFQYMGHLLSGVCPRGTPTKDFMRVDEKGKISFSPLPIAPIPGVGHSQSRTASQQPLGQVMQQSLGPIAQSPESTNSLLTTIHY